MPSSPETTKFCSRLWTRHHDPSSDGCRAPLKLRILLGYPGSSVVDKVRTRLVTLLKVTRNTTTKSYTPAFFVKNLSCLSNVSSLTIMLCKDPPARKTPIFIIDNPRTGSQLLHQYFVKHPQLESAPGRISSWLWQMCLVGQERLSAKMKISPEAVEADRILQEEIANWYRDRANVDVARDFTYENLQFVLMRSMAKVFAEFESSTVRMVRAIRLTSCSGQNPSISGTSSLPFATRPTARTASNRKHSESLVQPDISPRLFVHDNTEPSNTHSPSSQSDYVVLSLSAPETEVRYR